MEYLIFLVVWRKKIRPSVLGIKAPGGKLKKEQF